MYVFIAGVELFHFIKLTNSKRIKNKYSVMHAHNRRGQICSNLLTRNIAELNV